ncbi:hypothetical protein [Salinimicrobium oceani]|uniref:PH domain-containing protein n=1 Tax=Salinimicrobium oceani TaxID=2722702 RepID=A0ABX1D3I6_9FLAO|nr:hypothetical protein [Salinimicrobium oceani]NJW53081.1 hypothetical protein [Salinimicrobium oceani]
MTQNHFREIQRFNQWWLWISFLVLGVFLIYLNAVNLGALVLVVVSLIFLSLRLITNVDKAGVKFRFFPFVKKNYSWEEIESARIVNYGFVGGWGIRLFTSYGTVYNVKGDKGLAVKLKNGKKFCLGTQRPQELQETLDLLGPPRNSAL